MMRLLLDADVLMWLFIRDETGSNLAERLIALVYFGDAELWACATSFTGIFQALRERGYGSAVIQESFRRGFDWVNPCSVQMDDVKLAVERGWADFEDCVVAIAAEKVKADYLVTMREGSFGQSRISAISPEGLFELLEKEHGLIYDFVDAGA